MTIVLMLMHVGCGTMKCGSTTALVMAVGFSITVNKTCNLIKATCLHEKRPWGLQPHVINLFLTTILRACVHGINNNAVVF